MGELVDWADMLTKEPINYIVEGNKHKEEMDKWLEKRSGSNQFFRPHPTASNELQLLST